MPEEIVIKKKKKRRKKRYLLKLCILIIIIVGIYNIATSSLFNITKFTVVGNEHYTSEQVVKKAKIKLGYNIFKVKGSNINKELMKDPYFTNVKVKKKFPGHVIIDVTERKETCAILWEGLYNILNEDGLILRKTEIEPALPLLNNLTVKSATKGSAIDVEENPALKDVLELLKETKEVGLYFKKIDISPVVIRAYVYDQLVCDGTVENIRKNLKSLKETLLDLDSKNIERGTIKIGGEKYLSWQAMVE